MLSLGKKAAFAGAVAILLIVYFYDKEVIKNSTVSWVFGSTIVPAPITWIAIYFAYIICLYRNWMTMRKLGKQFEKNRSAYKAAVSSIIQG